MKTKTNDCIQCSIGIGIEQELCCAAAAVFFTATKLKCAKHKAVQLNIPATCGATLKCG
jgi:hypothetical protein